MTDAAEGQHVGLADEEGSVADQSSDAECLCGACRTRESKVWWKAPKGLATDTLCDACGVSWRKYADLNVRPLREESLSSGKAKSSEKREGTPLTGPSTKRARVCFVDVFAENFAKHQISDIGVYAIHTSTTHSQLCYTNSLLSLPV